MDTRTHPSLQICFENCIVFARRELEAGVVGSNSNQVLERGRVDNIERPIVKDNKLHQRSKESFLSQSSGPEKGTKWV